MKIVTVVATAILASSSFPVFAASISEIDQQIILLSVIPVSDFREYTPDKRKNIAQLVKSYWVQFDSVVPRNLPAEDIWLNKELSTSNGDRLARAFNTPIYARSQLAYLAEECVKNGEMLLNQINGPQNWELYAWIRILGCYNNSSDLLQQLQTAGLSNGRYDGPVPIIHSSALHKLIAGPIANAVITGTADIFRPSGQASEQKP